MFSWRVYCRFNLVHGNSLRHDLRVRFVLNNIMGPILSLHVRSFITFLVCLVPLIGVAGPLGGNGGFFRGDMGPLGEYAKVGKLIGDVGHGFTFNAVVPTAQEGSSSAVPAAPVTEPKQRPKVHIKLSTYALLGLSALIGPIVIYMLFRQGKANRRGK